MIRCSLAVPSSVLRKARSPSPLFPPVSRFSPNLDTGAVEAKGKGRAGTQHDGHNPNRAPNKKKKKKKKKGFFSFGKASESASA